MLYSRIPIYFLSHNVLSSPRHVLTRSLKSSDAAANPSTQSTWVQLKPTWVLYPVLARTSTVITRTLHKRIPQSIPH